MEITIRKATHQDREALCEIHVSSIRELGKSHYSEAEVDPWSKGRTPARYEGHISERHVIVAQNRSIPVGFGTLDLMKPMEYSSMQLTWKTAPPFPGS